jgi:phosphoglycolate phosphatase
LPDLPRRALPGCGAALPPALHGADQDLLLFDGAEALIDELAAAGYMLAVATGKTRKGLDRAFEVSGLGSRFHASRCADECHSKPHPQMLDELMDEFGVGPEVTLMIGDTTHDLLMAKNAGVAALGVAYGAHPRESLEAQAPLFCAADVAELAGWLRQQA